MCDCKRNVWNFKRLSEQQLPLMGERKNNFKQVNLSRSGYVGQWLYNPPEMGFKCKYSFITSHGDGLMRLFLSPDVSRSCRVSPTPSTFPQKAWEHDFPSETTKDLNSRIAQSCAHEGAKEWASLDQRQVGQCWFWGSLCALCIRFFVSQIWLWLVWLKRLIHRLKTYWITASSLSKH